MVVGPPQAGPRTGSSRNILTRNILLGKIHGDLRPSGGVYIRRCPERPLCDVVTGVWSGTLGLWPLIPGQF